VSLTAAIAGAHMLPKAPQSGHLPPKMAWSAGAAGRILLPVLVPLMLLLGLCPSHTSPEHCLGHTVSFYLASPLGRHVQHHVRNLHS